MEKIENSASFKIDDSQIKQLKNAINPILNNCINLCIGQCFDFAPHKFITDKAKIIVKTSNLEIVHIDNKTVYTKQKVKIYKKDTTKSKVLKTIPSNTKITIVSYTEKWGRLENGGFIQLKYLTEKNPEPTTPQSNKIEVADWWNSNINTLFSLNKTIKITDNKTKISWYVVRKGGTNHADVQPATAEDTAKMKEVCGGYWSWDRRGIIVEINNKQYAASMNCMPHGGDSIPNNNFNGHFCIHFTNSRTHGSNKICSLHQAAIQSVLK